jgi:prepilin-type N-terminal cleavage/methylation domain-containing protein/prepilin-type processing-associated H-X9-DG protein
MTQRVRAAKGFTALEILMVVSIIGVLAMLLLSVFGRVRESGRRSGCLSNLKQLSLGLQQYVQDNNSRFPSVPWPQVALMPYVKEDSLFQCPSENQPISTSYAMTPWMLMDPNGHSVLGRNEATLVDATTAISLFELIEDASTVEIESTCGIAKVGVSHFGGANYAFVDGHVKWLTSVQFAQLFCSGLP